ncbi:glycosyltransferase family 2 protein [Pseudomonas putida]|uniref:glycosyltransferase family 2 protein n=1 Tax=Pseudomonas putida TaxID=303 RepID=UPI0009B9F28C|nr:glycosyltransferase [Pseudomonas putida]
MNEKNLFKFGFDTLGPIINLYMMRLHSYLRQCDDPEHKVLFATRAGIRILELYQAWLTARGIKPPSNLVTFNSSRILSIKAAFNSNHTLAMTALGQELSGTPLEALIKSLIKPCLTKEEIESTLDVPAIPLHEFLNLDHPIAHRTKKYLAQQSADYKKYVDNIVGNSDRIILVDSGWKGTSQLLLEAAYPNLKWEGIYFGCIGRAEILGRRPSIMHGLMFDQEHIDESKPETAFLIHRHLIESLLEPNIPSFEEAPNLSSSKPDDFINETKEDWDSVYNGSLAYVKEHGSDSLSKIFAQYKSNMAKLANTLCYPSPDEVILACGKLRSHDLGREGSVSSVMPPATRFDGDSAELRVSQSIWQTGQVALEYPDISKRIATQRNLVNQQKKTLNQHYVLKSNSALHTDKHVAIITRTKNRPVLLKRAARSVASQTFEDYSWIVVNDGGNVEDVISVIEASDIDPLKVTICTNTESVGMEAASNIGIRNSQSEYIIIHDDDDSWDPRFLEKTVKFLEDKRDIYDAVITGTTYVSESIIDDNVISHGQWPYNDWIKNVQIAEMVVGNFFAPIAFLFKRKIYDLIDGFDEKLPVLGDWDFNLRYLMKSDIGVLREPLAYYHHRDQGSVSQTYSNSVIGGIDRHAEFNSVVRNKYIRGSNTNAEYQSLATLMASAFNHAELRHRLESTQGLLLGYTETSKQASINTENAQLELDTRWVALQIMCNSEISQPKQSQAELLTDISTNLDQYLTTINLDIPPDFDEDQYLNDNPDVRDAVREGLLYNGFDHYMKYGRRESRARPKTIIIHTEQG